jgi:hydrocephalus-inducing protein
MRQPLARTQYLEMRNLDNSAMSIETFFEKTQYLDVQLAPGQVLLPFSMGKDNILKIPITFTPRDNIKYSEIIQFDINGLHKIDVKIEGEGIPLRLELEKSEYANIDFGISAVKGDHTKFAKLINYGKKAITISFNIDDQLKGLKDKYAVSVLPEKEFTLGAREGTDIEIRFNPQTRLHQFKHELLYQIVDNKEVRKLLNVIGCCHGIELKMLEDTIGFGSVVLGSKVAKRC